VDESIGEEVSPKTYAQPQAQEFDSGLAFSEVVMVVWCSAEDRWIPTPS
jgi:hypothetical protein